MVASTMLLESPDLFSIARLIRGQDVRPNKKQKIDDLRPITFVTFNSRLGKAKPIRLQPCSTVAVPAR
jgi:hypothetical protein